MGKWVTLSLVAAASLGLIGSAFADVPNAALSSVACGCVADVNGGASTALPYSCTISPSGGNPPWVKNEDILTTVTVRNVLGAPLAGSTVVVVATAVLGSGSVFAWDPGPTPPADPVENPQTGLSNALGVFTAKHDEGGVNHAPGLYPNLDMVITAQGPGPGSPVTLVACPTKLNVTSYDLNGDCLVNLLDLVVFGGQYGGGFVPRIADFNWDNAVNLLDLILFGTNYGASCASN